MLWFTPALIVAIVLIFVLVGGLCLTAVVYTPPKERAGRATEILLEVLRTICKRP